MANILVLGANGFIGSHTVDKLASSNHRVRAFDRFKSKKPIFLNNPNVEIFPGDYLNKGDLKESLKDIDYVFHFISTTTPATSEDDPMIDIETNLRMSVELFQLCVEAGVKKVIFASTGGAIYGHADSQSDGSYNENSNTLPVSPYAIGKLTIEHYLRYFRVKHGLESIVFRISNPYGERQPFFSKQGVIPIFLEKIYRDDPITVFGDGSMTRDYIYVKDAVDLITSVFNLQTKHGLYNIGSGIATSLNQIIDSITEVTGRQVKIKHIETPSTYVHKSVLDVSRFTAEFDSAARTGILEGIGATYAYIDTEMQKEK